MQQLNHHGMPKSFSNVKELIRPLSDTLTRCLWSNICIWGGGGGGGGGFAFSVTLHCSRGRTCTWVWQRTSFFGHFSGRPFLPGLGFLKARSQRRTMPFLINRSSSSAICSCSARPACCTPHCMYVSLAKAGIVKAVDAENGPQQLLCSKLSWQPKLKEAPDQAVILRNFSTG